MATVSAALLAALLTIASPASASGASSNSPQSTGADNSTVATIQAEVAALEAQIGQQQQQVAMLSEQFDQSTVHLDQVHAQLTQIRTRLVADRNRYRSAHHELQVDAVSAYVYDEPATELSTMFSSTSATGSLDSEYQDTAIGNVDAAAEAVRSDERALEGTESRLGIEAQAARSGTQAVEQSEQAAQSTTTSAEATLATVKGQLAQMIAQEAAREAAREAAAAAAAANQAARQKAAEKAAQDAQVAQTVGGGSEAATAATDSANQAAGSAGSTGVVGNGSSEPSEGAGAVALEAAEGYLGVPYEFGGASTSGVDCSGLTMLAWQAAGVSLLHSAAAQRGESTPVPLSQVQPGDLLFYDLGGDGIDHVVMYVGSGPYGADTIIQAAHTGTVVSFDPVWYFGLVGAGQP
jgi:cell wall-associated NlpC family hydrolase